VLLFHCAFIIWTQAGDTGLVDLFTRVHYKSFPDLDLAIPGFDFLALDNADVHGRRSR
jgi:hypothetical protein